MYHVAIISENRILLKQIYDMIEDPSCFRIHVIPFSMDAYETFYLNHAEIVILDTSVFLPYVNILEQLKQCQWNYHVLLIHEGQPDFEPEENTFWLPREKLSRELFQEIFTHIDQHTLWARKDFISIILDWNGRHSFTVYPDAYHLIYVKNLSKKVSSSESDRLLAELSDYCTAKELFCTGREILLLISRSQTLDTFHLPLIFEIIFKVIGRDTGILYEKNINWKILHDTCIDFKEHNDFCYFLKGGAAALSYIRTTHTGTSLADIRIQCGQLLTALLENNKNNAFSILQDLYLHIIKPCFDFSILEYLRIQLYFIFYLLRRQKTDFNYLSLEAEFESLSQSTFLDKRNFSSPRIQEVITKTVLAVYEQFDTGISLDGIAQAQNLNKIYLNRIFKEYFNFTVLESLQKLRLIHAKYYLLYTDKKVSAIALETGFTDAGYFGKFFRGLTGYTPLEFRMKREDRKEMKEKYASIMEI